MKAKREQDNGELMVIKLFASNYARDLMMTINLFRVNYARDLLYM